MYCLGGIEIGPPLEYGYISPAKARRSRKRDCDESLAKRARRAAAECSKTKHQGTSHVEELLEAVGLLDFQKRKTCRLLVNHSQSTSMFVTWTLAHLLQTVSKARQDTSPAPTFAINLVEGGGGGGVSILLPYRSAAQAQGKHRQGRGGGMGLISG